MTFSWTDIEDIVIELDEAHPEVDPAAVRFTLLRTLIESLDGFAPEPGQNVNEQILEAVQAGWIQERADAQADAPADAPTDAPSNSDCDPEDDDDKPGYAPNNPFR